MVRSSWAGKDGVILRYHEGEFERMQTPGTGTVYGIWGVAPDDLWAVGGQLPAGAFAWRYDGESWTKAPGFPAELTETQSMFKVWGPGSGRCLDGRYWRSRCPFRWLEFQSGGLGDIAHPVHRPRR